MDHKRPTLRQRIEEASVGIVVSVVGGVILAIVVVVILGLNAREGGRSDSGGSESEPVVRTPPPALQAQDKMVPDAKGPVGERVWAKEGSRTFENPYDLAGEGQRVPYNTPVKVACKIYWPELRSVKHDGYWYRLLTPPWKDLYSPANSYWNGDKPGEPATHSVDWAVRECGSSS